MVLEVELSETRFLLTRYSSTPATFPLRAAAIPIRRYQSVREAVLTCCPERERIILLEWLHSAYISTLLNKKVRFESVLLRQGVPSGKREDLSTGTNNAENSFFTIPAAVRTSGLRDLENIMAIIHLRKYGVHNTYSVAVLE